LKLGMALEARDFSWWPQTQDPANQLDLVLFATERSSG
jgi:hypothetical protein